MTERDGLVELSASSDVLDSPRYNHDIAPTRVEQRTWNRWYTTTLRIGTSICVLTYTFGDVLTAYFDLGVSEALLATLLASLVVLIPLTLNASVGTRYGIPFPVLLCVPLGIIGSNVLCLIRVMAACGWFGIQTLFGGLAIHLFLSSIFSAWKTLGGTGEVIGSLLLWGLNLQVVLRGAESIEWLETLSAPLLVLVGLSLLVRALPHISTSELLAQPPKQSEGVSVTGYFMAGLTAMAGFWATLSLNIPDSSRYVRSQKDQILGQIFGLPLITFLFAAFGVAMIAVSASLVGEMIPDPASLIGYTPSPGWVAVAMALIIVATFSTNVAANIVPSTSDFQNIAPKLISRTRAVWLTDFIGLAPTVHELLKKLGWVISDLSLESVYPNQLFGYFSLLGSIAGIMVVDYFLIRRQRLDLVGLYRDDAYPVWNWSGFTAFAVLVALTVMALGNRRFYWFYDYSWSTGSLLGGALYYGLCGCRAWSPAASAKSLPRQIYRRPASRRHLFQA